MQFLFVHQNFPGQYRHLALHFAKAGHRVVAIGEKANVVRQRAMVPGIELFGYELPPESAAARSGSQLHPAVHRARIVAGAASALRRSGFQPDAIFAHIGWGEALFLKDVFPQAQLQLYCEFFYRSKGSDVDFDPEFPARPDSGFRLRMKNAPLLMALDASDRGVTPTRWQQQQFPAGYASKISVIHDGIYTDLVTPGTHARFRIPGTDTLLSTDDQVITYVSRNLEPYRGFHTFMRTVPEIQRRLPQARIVIVGGDDVSYSARLPAGQSYRDRLTRELEGKIDYSRVVMTGRIPYAEYLSLLRVSSAHVYLTYPFVLSWSMLEAMSAGCVVIGSRTSPVEEVITHGENGLLADFFSPVDIADQVERVVKADDRLRAMREAARRTVVNCYDLKRVCLPKQAKLVQNLLLERAA